MATSPGGDSTAASSPETGDRTATRPAWDPPPPPPNTRGAAAAAAAATAAESALSSSHGAWRGVPRRSLQALAKANGVKANGKSADLMAQLVRKGVSVPPPRPPDGGGGRAGGCVGEAGEAAAGAGADASVPGGGRGKGSKKISERRGSSRKRGGAGAVGGRRVELPSFPLEYMGGKPVIYRYPGPLRRGRLVRRYKRFIAEVRVGVEDLGGDIVDGGGGGGGAVEVVGCHCPNTGPMLGLGMEDRPEVLISVAPKGRKRKLPYTLEAVRVGEVWVGTHSALANAMIANALAAGLLPELGGNALQEIRREVPHGESTRFDFLLTRAPQASTSPPRTLSESEPPGPAGSSETPVTRRAPGRSASETAGAAPARPGAASGPAGQDGLSGESTTILEVKSVTLATHISTEVGQGDGAESGGGGGGGDGAGGPPPLPPPQLRAEFPDTVSVRARRHASELAAIAAAAAARARTGGPPRGDGAGSQAAAAAAVLLFLVQRGDCTSFAPCRAADPEYCQAVEEAAAAGVEVLAYACSLRLVQRPSPARSPSSGGRGDYVVDGAGRGSGRSDTGGSGVGSGGGGGGGDGDDSGAVRELHGDCPPEYDGVVLLEGRLPVEYPVLLQE